MLSASAQSLRWDERSVKRPVLPLLDRRLGNRSTAGREGESRATGDFRQKLGQGEGTIAEAKLLRNFLRCEHYRGHRFFFR
jgi:hypothetical protein